MFAYSLLAVPAVWDAVGYEALSVTSCSILFLCCCASALRPLGLTLHCSSNNCCGTLNICKPPLLFTQLPLHWAHALCAAAVLCACLCESEWVYVFSAQLVRLCVAYYSGHICEPLCMCAYMGDLSLLYVCDMYLFNQKSTPHTHMRAHTYICHCAPVLPSLALTFL